MVLCPAQTSTVKTAAPAQAKPSAKKPTGTATALKPKPTTAVPALKTSKDKMSYALGADLGKNLKLQGIEVDAALVARGIKDATSSGKTLLKDEEIRALLLELQGIVKQKQGVEAKIVSEKNKKAGVAFLAANKAKDGVVTLPSGMQYKILKAGDGKKPGLTDSVVCNYRGTLLNGTEFDSS